MDLIKVIEEWNKENLIPDGKRYRSKDGKYLSSPTALLRALDPVGQKAMQAIPPFILEKCRVIGNDFEEAIHMYELGEIDEHEIAEQLFGSAKKMFLSFVEYRKTKPELEFIANNVLVGQRNLFGYVDFIYYNTKTKEHLIVELKTGKDKPRLAHYAQLYFYSGCIWKFLWPGQFKTFTEELWFGKRSDGTFHVRDMDAIDKIEMIKIETLTDRAYEIATMIQQAQEVLKEEQ